MGEKKKEEKGKAEEMAEKLVKL